MPPRRAPARLTPLGWAALAVGLPIHALAAWALLVGYAGSAAAVLAGPPPDTMEREARAAGIVGRCEAAVRARGLTPEPVPLPPPDGLPTVPSRYISVLRDDRGNDGWTLGVPVAGGRAVTCRVTPGGRVTVSTW